MSDDLTEPRDRRDALQWLSFGLDAAAVRFVRADSEEGGSVGALGGDEPAVPVAWLSPDDLVATERLHARLAGALGLPSYYSGPHAP